MRRQVVVSSSIVSVGYSALERILELEFRNGRIYQYVDVPPSAHLELMSATSKGVHINRCIRGRFPHRSVTEVAQ